MSVTKLILFAIPCDPTFPLISITAIKLSASPMCARGGVSCSSVTARGVRRGGMLHSVNTETVAAAEEETELELRLNRQCQVSKQLLQYL